MDKICANCGKVLQEDEIFCGNCGTKYEAPAVEEIVAEAVAEDDIPAADETPVAMENPVAEEEISAAADNPVAEEVPVAEAVFEAAPAVFAESTPAQATAKFNINGAVDKVMEIGGEYLEKAKAKPVLFAIPAGIVAGVIAIIVIFGLIFGGAAEEKAVKKYLNVMLNAKTDKIESLVPDRVWKYMNEYSDFDLDEILEEYIEEIDDDHEYFIDRLEEEYGRNIKFSYKIVETKKLSKKRTQNIADDLKDRYDIPIKTVKEAYKVEVELKVRGKEDERTVDLEFTSVKIGGKWYVYNFVELIHDPDEFYYDICDIAMR